jgi:isoleucyl-tRNA synthetase
MLPIRLKLSLNRRKIAPRVKADLKKVLDAFNNLDYNQVIRELSKGKFVLAYDSKEVEISIDDVDIDYEVKEGYTLAERDGIFVFLTTERDQELIAKGVVRDIARRLQALRKERGYNPTDILNVAYVANLDDNTVNLLENLLDELAYLVRVKEVKLLKDAIDGVNWQESELDGKKILISIE